VTEKKQILLVDDEPGIRTTLSISLMDMGYEVTTAESGEAALEKFDADDPPIVLTDIKMPGIDGIELLRKLKGRNPHAEVIMITGHGDMELAIESLKNEATDFITKPIRDDVLEIALKRANDRIAMRRRLQEYTENLEEMVREKSEKLVKAERLLALDQAVEGLSSAIWGLAGEIDGDLKYFNELPCFVSLHDRDLKVLAINQLYRERLGDRVGADSWTAYAGRSGNPDRCPVARTLETEQGQRREETIQHQGDQIPVIVHTAPIRNTEGRVTLVIEIAADVTQFNRLQDELRTIRRKYRLLFDEVPCYISVQDRDLKVTETNRRFKEDFGEAEGQYCYNIYKGRTDPCVDCPVMDSFTDGKSHSKEAVVRSREGEEINVLIWTAPLRDSTGEITHVMEMATNITQLHKLRDQLSDLGLLIGSISHGIKGMLTGLDGGVYLLNRGFAKDDREMMEEGWETVQLMIERIRSMILDILYYAKERDLNWERVDVLSFVSDVAETFAPKIGGADIRFTTDFDDSLGEFEIDPGVVRSALISILENALDACVEDKEKPAHTIRFAAHPDDEEEGAVLFTISDDGIGMDKEALDALFTLFFSMKGQKGTGLGLFVSKKIINQHGGTIHVESAPGEGTTFTIRLPKELPESVKDA
jgi:PAS domain S-box-containing protein